MEIDPKSLYHKFVVINNAGSILNIQEPLSGNTTAGIITGMVAFIDNLKKILSNKNVLGEYIIQYITNGNTYTININNRLQVLY